MSTKQAFTLPTLSAMYKAGKLVAPDVEPLSAPSQRLNDKIALWRGDITKLDIEVIVNAANRGLLGGGGVDGAIHRAAGRELLKMCLTLDGCETGQSKITPGFRLPSEKIIHTVGPVYDNYSKEDAHKLLASCYRTSLELAVQEGCRSIAFCAISTGIYGYPSALAAVTAMTTVHEFLAGPDGNKINKVVFVVFETKDVVSYEQNLPRIFPPVVEDSAAESAAGTTPKVDTETLKKDSR